MNVVEKINAIKKELDALSKELTTEVVVVLDRSGSMNSNKSDHEGGLRNFIEEQKKGGDNRLFTFVKFDDANPFEIVYDGIPINQVRAVSLEPRGCTPLYDAIGKTINHVSKRSSSDVLFLIVTDGLENSSKEFSLSAIKSLIEQKKTEGWQFTFIGTNFDVFSTGVGLGVDSGKNAQFNNTSASINAVYSMAGNKINKYARSRASGQSVHQSSEDLNFSNEEINEIRSL